MRDAEEWFAAAAGRAICAGERLDPLALALLVALAPHEGYVHAAIEQVEPAPAEHGLAALAHEVSATLQSEAARADLAIARLAVTSLEERILPVYIPGRGVGRLEDDVAVAHAMLDAHRFGGDDTHLMMAEELMLSVVRRYWPELARHPLPVMCEAAVVLDALGRVAEKPEYRARAVEVLEAFAGSYRDFGWRAAPFVLALEMIS